MKHGVIHSELHIKKISCIRLIEAESHRLNNYNHFLGIRMGYDSSDN
jgi:hypothetical protein